MKAKVILRISCHWATPFSVRDIVIYNPLFWLLSLVLSPELSEVTRPFDIRVDIRELGPS